MAKPFVIVGGGIAAALSLAFLLGNITTVETTEHCVLTRYGNVIEKKMAPGLAFTPFSTTTCFPLTDQNYPEAGTLEITPKTRDPLQLTAKLRVIYSYDPATVYDLYLDKRDQAKAEAEIHSTIESGTSNAFSAWYLNDIFGPRQSELNDSVRTVVQRLLGKRAKVLRVLVTDIKAPASIEQARIATMAKEQEVQLARRQFEKDSIQNATTLMQVATEARKTALEAEALAKNEQMMQLRIAEATAAGLQGICGQATTCVIGAETMQQMWSNLGARR